MKIVFLGSGGSMGVPVVGCQCLTCISDNIKNYRYRPSVLLLDEDRRFLIDVGPDYRLQALKYAITHVDGILLTHTHWDHISGIDDLRSYSMLNAGKRIPFLVSQVTYDELKRRYSYLFSPYGVFDESIEKISVLPNDQGSMIFQGLNISYFTYFQSKTQVIGFCFQGNRSLAYVTDIMTYDSSVIDACRDVDVLVLSVSKWDQSLSHISINEGLLFAEKVGAKYTYFTHISHDIEHGKDSLSLPDGVEFAYDGLEVEL